MGEWENPHTHGSISSPKELTVLLSYYQVPIRIHSIDKALDRLVSKHNLSELFREGIISRDNLEQLFQGVITWKTLISQYKSFSSHGSNPISLPFAYPQRDEKSVADDEEAEPDKYSYPVDYDIRYLPYLISGVNAYLNSIPSLLSAGRVFPLPEVGPYLERLRTLCQITLETQRNDFDKETVKDVIASVNEQLAILNDTYVEMMASGSWNKRRSTVTELGEVINFRSIRDQIWAAGGRAPRHLDIKRAHQVRKGLE